MTGHFLILSLAVATLYSCGSNRTKSIATLAVTRDTVMTHLLFPEGQWGLTAGDASISIPLGSDVSLWLWGDSFVGNITSGKKAPGTRMIFGNVITVLDDRNVRTIIGGTPDAPYAPIPCESVEGKQAVYWPHHGFARDGVVHLFASRIIFGGGGMWDFKADEVRYFRLDASDLKVIDSREIGAFRINTVGYGYGLHEYKGYYYLYGNRPEGGNNASLHAARAHLVDGVLQDLEYFDGTGWSVDPSRTAPLQGVDVAVSSQFSIFRHKDKWILINQQKGIGKNDIFSFISDTPTGPWRNKKLIYSVTETLQDRNLYAYNSMAHPQYPYADHLLVSYCLNTHTPMEVNSDYRPRFILVPYELILE